MSFMQAQMTTKTEWVELDTSDGTTFVPNEEVGLTRSMCRTIEKSDEVPSCLKDFVDRGVVLNGVRLIQGYGVRSSAPGYMDRTDWSVYGNRREAKSAYREEERECEGGER